MKSPLKAEKEPPSQKTAVEGAPRPALQTQGLPQDGPTGSIPIQYLASMLDSAQEAIVVLQDEIHKYVNRRASEIDGRPVADLIGRHIRETTHPGDYEMALQSYVKKMKGEPVNKYRYRGIDRNGQIIWLEIVGTSILWEGRPAVLNFVNEVTKQVRAEEDLKKSERMLWDIINFLPDPTFAIDGESRIISWNREMEKMVEVKAEEMIGKGDYEYALPFYGERIPMLVDLIRRPDPERERAYSYFKREDRFVYAEHGYRLHGESRRLWCKASLIYDHNDMAIGAIESMRDVTEFRTAVEELKNQSLHLEEVNTALKVLLQHRQNDRREIEEWIAGNIKTLISPYLDKLKDTKLETEQKAYVNILENHLTEIVSPFLTNMTNRHPNLTPREIQIADLVKEGKSAKEIAQILNIALYTAQNYRKRLRKKFALRSKDKNLRSHLLSFT